MKYLIAFALATIVSVSCKKQDDATPDPQVPMQQVVGVWKISSYIDNNGRDKTSRFSGYNFSFLTGGKRGGAKKHDALQKGHMDQRFQLLDEYYRAENRRATAGGRFSRSE